MSSRGNQASPIWAHVGNLNDVYLRTGLSAVKENEGAKRSIRIANSGAVIFIAESPGEQPRLSYESQVAPLTLMSVGNVTIFSGR